MAVPTDPRDKRPASTLGSPRVLHSWKEISAWLGRGVRTAQRWEVQFGMPVHRPAGRDRTAVFAVVEEIDAWLHRCAVRERPAEILDAAQGLERERMQRNRDALGKRTSLMCSRVETLRQEMERLLAFQDRLRTRLDEGGAARAVVASGGRREN